MARNCRIHCARRNAGGKGLHVISKARIEAPPERRELTDPFWRKDTLKRRLHQRSRRFATRAAIGQSFALDVFVAVPNGGVSVLARTVQIQNVLQARLDASFAGLGSLGESDGRRSKQHRGDGNLQSE